MLKCEKFISVNGSGVYDFWWANAGWYRSKKQEENLLLLSLSHRMDQNWKKYIYYMRYQAFWSILYAVDGPFGFDGFFSLFHENINFNTNNFIDLSPPPSDRVIFRWKNNLDKCKAKWSTFIWFDLILYYRNKTKFTMNWDRSFLDIIKTEKKLTIHNCTTEWHTQWEWETILKLLLFSVFTKAIQINQMRLKISHIEWNDVHNTTTITTNIVIITRHQNKSQYDEKR